MQFKKIGILGGMGPEATANFYSKIINLAQKKYGAIQDTDYPPVVIYSFPLQGFDEAGIKDFTLVKQQLLEGITVLENAGCDFIVMPCNTIHYFIDAMISESSIPILSIVEETAKKIKSDSLGYVGLLASETTLNLGLYDSFFKKHNIPFLIPPKHKHKLISGLILEIMSGKVSKMTKQKVLKIISAMKKKSAKGIVLGCTELPLAITKKDIDLKIYDSLEILAEAALDYSLD